MGSVFAGFWRWTPPEWELLPYDHRPQDTIDEDGEYDGGGTLGLAPGTEIITVSSDEVRGHALLANVVAAHGAVLPVCIIHSSVVSWTRISVPQPRTSLIEALVENRLTVPDIYAIGADITEAVVFFASCGLVHGDIAPCTVDVIQPTHSEAGERPTPRGVVSKLGPLRRVCPGAEAVWLGQAGARAHFFAVARHRRLENDPPPVDITDCLESVGWLMLCCVCQATSTPFPLSTYEVTDAVPVGVGVGGVLGWHTRRTISLLERDLYLTKCKVRDSLSGRRRSPMFTSSDFAPLRAYFTRLSAIPRRPPDASNVAVSGIASLLPGELGELHRCLLPVHNTT